MSSLYETSYISAAQVQPMLSLMKNLGYFLGLQTMTIRGIIDVFIYDVNAPDHSILISQARLGKRYTLISREILRFVFAYHQPTIMTRELANGGFQEQHMKICGLLRHFSLLWDIDLTRFANTIPYWPAVQDPSQVEYWRSLLMAWRAPAFPASLRAIITTNFTQDDWVDLWRLSTDWEDIILSYESDENRMHNS